jgi:hypothetical protein
MHPGRNINQWRVIINIGVMAGGWPQKWRLAFGGVAYCGG